MGGFLSRGWLVSFLKSFSKKLAKILAAYGGWGLFGMAFLDSAGISMPAVKDLLLIYLCAKHPWRAWLYALAVALGTAVGSLVIYGFGRTGARLFGRKPSRENVSRAKRWLGQNDFVTVVVASLIPPPLPFKPFLFAAGALRINVLRFLAAVLVGTALRCGVEAWFGVRYGMGGAEYLRKNFLWLSLILLAIIAALIFLQRLFRRTPAELDASAAPEPPPPPAGG
jgi:membrane protein YqaA with SNARE-associated domain